MLTESRFDELTQIAQEAAHCVRPSVQLRESFVAAVREAEQGQLAKLFPVDVMNAIQTNSPNAHEFEGVQKLAMAACNAERPGTWPDQPAESKRRYARLALAVVKSILSNNEEGNEHG